MREIKNIEVVPYNPDWPKIFKTETTYIKNALGSNCIAIHHVGSTAVPGLSAKPKVDIIAEVKNLDFEHSKLENLDYSYSGGGFNIPLRKSFTLRTENLKINLHVFEKDDPEIKLNLLFRDYLRNHSDVRDQYAKLKYKLIAEESAYQKQEGAIYRDYTLNKSDFIQEVLKKTGFNQLRFVLCAHHNEWLIAKHFRQKYFFGKVNITDPYHWTFNHPQHKHFVLYQGTEIIGYAHIVLWPEARAALRIIVIDESKRNNNFGGKFLALCEKWLKSQSYNSIHAESSPAALNFYKKNGYIEMPFNDPEGYEGGAEDIAVGKMLY
jgi:GrpB-like predicted nucleotidyltransferase (UPF0157 family)